MCKTVVVAMGIVLVLGAAAPAFSQSAAGMSTETKVTATAGPGMMGMCKMGSMSDMPKMAKLTKEQRKQLFDMHVKFFNETAQLKFDISEKRTELDALWEVDNPEAKAILAKWSEVDALELKLREKTVDCRIKVRKIAGKNCPCGTDMGMGMGMCSGMGCGMHDGMMMPGMGGMGSGPQMIQIEKRKGMPGGAPEGNE